MPANREQPASRPLQGGREVGDDAPAARQRRVWLRLSTPVWVGLGAFFVVGIGVALWLASQRERLETQAEITRLIASEEEYSLVGDVAVVIALQDQRDPAWVQARAAQVQAEQPAPNPVPVATIVPDSVTIRAITVLDGETVQADVQRDYRRAGDERSVTFELQQFYRLDEAVGWARTAPPATFWGDLSLWSGAQLRVGHYGRDELLVSMLMPDVDDLLTSVCELWGGCRPDEPVYMYLTNSPAVFLDSPLLNTRVVLDAAAQATLGLPPEQTYLHIVSPHLAGLPLDAAGREWLVQSYAVRAIADLAERRAGPGPQAAALHEQALVSLGIALADAGLRFEAPVAAVAETPALEPTATPTLVPTPVLARYVVQSGDALMRIAEQFNTTVELIMAFNGLSDPDSIFVEQELLIPPTDAVPPTATPLPTPTISATPAPSSTPVPPGTIVEYTVRQGDTLVGIAAFYETSVEAIVAENGLANQDAIFAGQVLRVPVGLARER